MAAGSIPEAPLARTSEPPAEGPGTAPPAGIGQAPLLAMAVALWSGIAVSSLLPPAWAGIWVSAGWAVLAAGALAVASGPVRRRRLAATVLLLVAFFFAGILGRPGSGSESSLAAEARSLGEERLRRAVRLEGALIEDPRDRPEVTVLRLEVDSLEASRRVIKVRGQARIEVNGSRDSLAGLASGARISAWTRVSEPRSPGNPGGRDLSGPLALFGSTKSGLLVEESRPASDFARLLRAARNGIRDRLNQSGMSPEVVGMTAAVLIGDRTLVPVSLERAFRDAGTLHLLAVSGLHVGLLGLLIYGVAILLGLTRRNALVAVMVLLPLYAVLCGGRPSVVRAVLMACGVILGLRRGLAPGALNGLGLAAFGLLLWSPQNALDVGFQLSFAATAAILGVLRPPDPATASWDPPPVWRTALIGPLAVTLAAQMAAFPIVAWHFSRVVFGGLLVAVPAGLLAGPMLSLGFGWLALGDLPGLGPLLGFLLQTVAEALIGLSRWAASLPLGAFQIPRPGVPWMALWVVFAGGLLRGRRRHRFRFAVPLVELAVWTLPLRPPADGVLRFTALDVGMGDALVIGLPRGGALLVDAGPAFRGFSAGESVVVPFLAERGHSGLRAAVATHGDLDHIGGFPAVFRDIRVDEFWEGMATAADDRPAVRRLHRERERWGIPLLRLSAGAVRQIEGVRLRVLFAGGPEGDRPRRPNDRSLVLSVEYSGRRLLLTGDAGEPTERVLLECCRDALAADVLKVGHHGSRTSTTAAFVRAVKPQAAVVSTRFDARRRLPDSGVLERLRQAGAAVFRTDESGAVTVEIHPDGALRIRTHRDFAGTTALTGSPPFLPPRSSVAAEGTPRPPLSRCPRVAGRRLAAPPPDRGRRSGPMPRPRAAALQAPARRSRGRHPAASLPPFVEAPPASALPVRSPPFAAPPGPRAGPAPCWRKAAPAGLPARRPSPSAAASRGVLPSP